MSDMSLASPTTQPELDSSCLDGDEPQAGPSNTVELGQRGSSTTSVFSSGRSNDSGACVRAKCEDEMTELDNVVPMVDDPPDHGPLCSCVKCYRILQVDGADSTTDTEEDAPSAVYPSDSAGKKVNKVKKGNLPRDPPVDGSYASLLKLTNSIDPAWLVLEAREKKKAEQEVAPAVGEPSPGGPVSQSTSDPGPSTSGLRNKRTGPRYVTPGKNSARNERFRKRLRPCVELLDERPKSKAARRAALARCLVLSSDTEAEDDPPLLEAANANEPAAVVAEDQAAATEDVIVPVDRSKGVEVDDPKDKIYRVRNWNGSDTEASDGESTDYSDTEDLRNFFADVRHAAVAETNVILGKGKKKRRRKYLNPDDTMSGPESDTGKEKSIVSKIHSASQAAFLAACLAQVCYCCLCLCFLFQFERPLQDKHRGLIWVDRGPPEELPVNVQQALHFPERNVLDSTPDEIFMEMLTDGAKHHVPLVYMEKDWSRICDQYERFTGERPMGFYHLRRQVIDKLPGCTVHYTLENKSTGQIRYVEGRSFKKAKYPADKYRPLLCETRANLQELMAYHASLHKGETGRAMSEAVLEKHVIPLHFFVDGVSPSTTGSAKMICEVVKHECCNLILNYNTIVYAKDYAITPEDLLQGIIADLHRAPNMNIKLVICDMPERLRLSGLTSHNGEFGCLTCLSPGEKRIGGPGVIWPPSTMGAPLRDDASFEKLAEATRDTGLVVGGQKTKSPLLNIPGFSIVDCVAVDPMHLISGLVKYYWEKMSDKFLTKAQAKALTDAMSKVYCDIDFPSDFKRKNRPLDPKRWRCNEWKQFITLIGIDICDFYKSQGHPKVAQFWLRLTWIVRAMAQGDAWYKQASQNGKLVKSQLEILYKSVEELLGANCCTPNLHAFYHLPIWREKHPLGKITTERAESFYGVNRRSFAEKSCSIGKQIHVNTLLAAREGHACITKFKFRPKLERHDMDHILIDNTRGVYYLEGEDASSEHYRVRKVHCMPYNDAFAFFTWSKVGVMRVCGAEQTETRIAKNTVIAKGVVRPDNILISWTRDLHDF